MNGRNRGGCTVLKCLRRGDPNTFPSHIELLDDILPSLSVKKSKLLGTCYSSLAVGNVNSKVDLGWYHQ